MPSPTPPDFSTGAGPPNSPGPIAWRPPARVDVTAPRAFKAALVCEDSAASRHAVAFAYKLAHGLFPGAKLEPEFWGFDLLADPAGRRLAESGIASADAVVVAARTAPPGIVMDSWLRAIVAAECIVAHLQRSPAGFWNVTIRHSPTFSLGRVGAHPEIVEIFRGSSGDPPLRRSA